MKLKKYIYFFTFGIANGLILNSTDLDLSDLLFWLEIGIAYIMSVIIMIIFRNKL